MEKCVNIEKKLEVEEGGFVALWKSFSFLVFHLYFLLSFCLIPLLLQTILFAAWHSGFWSDKTEHLRHSRIATKETTKFPQFTLKQWCGVHTLWSYKKEAQPTPKVLHKQIYLKKFKQLFFLACAFSFHLCTFVPFFGNERKNNYCIWSVFRSFQLGKTINWSSNYMWTAHRWAFGSASVRRYKEGHASVFSLPTSTLNVIKWKLCGSENLNYSLQFSVISEKKTEGRVMHDCIFNAYVAYCARKLGPWWWWCHTNNTQHFFKKMCGWIVHSTFFSKNFIIKYAISVYSICFGTISSNIFGAWSCLNSVHSSIFSGKTEFKFNRRIFVDVVDIMMPLIFTANQVNEFLCDCFNNVNQILL